MIVKVDFLFWYISHNWWFLIYHSWGHIISTSDWWSVKTHNSTSTTWWANISWINILDSLDIWVHFWQFFRVFSYSYRSWRVISFKNWRRSACIVLLVSNAILVLLLYVTLFHHNSQLLRLWQLFRLNGLNYVLFICTDITTTRLNRMWRDCSTFIWVDTANYFIWWLFLIICTSWIWYHNSSSLFWVTFISLTLLWELRLTLLLRKISSFRVIFCGSCALLFPNKLSWIVYYDILVAVVFLVWVNRLNLVS